MRRRAIFVLVSALFAAACTVPLGPGFFIERESLETRFVVAPPGASGPHLEIFARFEISNAGNVPLDAVALALPGSGYAHAILRVEVAGRSVEPQGAPRADTPVVRVPIEPPLALKGKTAIAVSYALTRAGEEIGGRMAADAVFLPPGSWTPRLLPPERLFAKGGQRPKKFEFTATLPAEFRVHAGGKPQGTRGARGASDVTHRFLIRDDDPQPYLLAGKFSAASYSAHGATVTFWTVEPLLPDDLQLAGPRLVATLSSLTATLGPRIGNGKTALIISLPAGNSPRESLETYPDAAVVSPPLAPGNIRESDLCAGGFALAELWFLALSAPAPEVETLAQNLSKRAVSQADRACTAFALGHPERTPAVQRGLAEFDELLTRAKNNTPAAAGSSARAIEITRHRLFLFALEDELGAETVNRALRHMLQSLRGSTWGENDLRAALEAAAAPEPGRGKSRRDLAKFFRDWLRSDSIPADFRARYAKP